MWVRIWSVSERIIWAWWVHRNTAIRPSLRDVSPELGLLYSPYSVENCFVGTPPRTMERACYPSARPSPTAFANREITHAAWYGFEFWGI